MTRKVAACPVLFVADRSAERSSCAQLHRDGVVGVVGEELVEGVRLGDEADDRDQDEEERHRRQERVVGELARDPGDVVDDRAAGRRRAPRRTNQTARRRIGDPIDRASDLWVGQRCSSGLDIPPRGPAQRRPSAAGRAPELPRRPGRGAPAHPHGGRTGAPARAYFPSRVVLLPPRGSSEARGARAQRLGFLGIAPPIVWSSVGAALTSSPRAAAAAIVAAWSSASSEPGLMGSGMIRNLAAAGPRGAPATRAPRPAREGLPVTARGVDRRGRRRGRPGLLVRDRLARRRRGGRRRCWAPRAPAPVLVEMSTIAPAVARELAARCAERGVAYLDCPVSGGPTGAAAGTLAFMCGGDAATPSRPPPRPSTRWAIPTSASTAARSASGWSRSSSTTCWWRRSPSRRPRRSAPVPAGRASIPALAREVVMRSSGDSWQLRNLFPRILAGDHVPGLHDPATCSRTSATPRDLDDATPEALAALARELLRADRRRCRLRRRGPPHHGPPR